MLSIWDLLIGAHVGQDGADEWRARTEMKRKDQRKAKNRTKMTDVARLAGVSVATVSRALAASGPVSAAARRRIEKALQATGYTLNSVARSLRRQESRTIIVIVPDVGQQFFSIVLRGIEERAIAIGYSVLVGNSAHDVRREALYAEHVMAGRADGLILVNGRLPRFGPDAKPWLPPIVVVSERISGIDLPMVGVDNAAAAETAVRHLLELGHRRIAHIAGGRRNAMTAERSSGYRQALRNFGLVPVADLVSYGDYSIESGTRAARALLDLSRPPTAIFAANDDMAIGAMNEAKARGMRVPEDISVVGFDDVPFAASCDPPLTTIRQPFFDMGTAAMDTLYGLLKDQPPKPHIRLLPTDLMIRQTTAKRAPRGR
jgi:LacI family repressor for deo operon, udp, cdd, tsx, nupC, and nupG